METNQFSNSQIARAVNFDKNFFSNPKKVQMRRVDIFPALAQLWLAKRNNQNRAKGNSDVVFLSRQMSGNLWSLTNQGIGFDWDAQLNDGQTRLAAVVASGATVSMYVSTGEDPINRLRVDCGRKRTTEHYLQMFSDYPNPKIAGTALWSLRHFGLGDRLRLTGEQVVEVAKQYRRSLEWICAVVGKGTWRHSAIIGAVAFAYAVDPDDVSKAYDDLKTGAGMSARDPILVFRNIYQGAHIHSSDERQEAFNKLLAAIYHRINGTQVTQIKQSDEAIRFFRSGKKSKKASTKTIDLPFAGSVKESRLNGTAVHV